MSLKKLTSFQTFDSTSFFKDKAFLFTKSEDWKEGEDSDHMVSVGTKVTGVIFQDETNYGHELKGLNEGESITFKVRQPLSAFSNWQPFGTQFVVNKVEKASIWGDFRNQLSVKVPSLEVVSRGD